MVGLCQSPACVPLNRSLPWVRAAAPARSVGRIRASLIRIPHTPSDTSHDRATSSASWYAAEFDDRRNARLYDLTQPLIINKTPICQAVAELLRQRRWTPRIAELGCGTGLFSLPVLAALDSFDYLGLTHPEP